MSQVKQRIKSKVSDPPKTSAPVIKTDENDKIPNTKNVKNKFGPMGIKKEDQVWTRGVMFASLTIIVAVMKWRKMGGEINWAAQNEIITEPRSHFLPCSPKYLDETKKFEGLFRYYYYTYLRLSMCLFRSFRMRAETVREIRGGRPVPRRSNRDAGQDIRQRIGQRTFVRRSQHPRPAFRCFIERRELHQRL